MRNRDRPVIEAIVLRIKELELSQKEVCALTGIAYTALSKYLHGKLNLTNDVIKKFSNGLKTDFSKYIDNSLYENAIIDNNVVKEPPPYTESVRVVENETQLIAYLINHNKELRKDLEWIREQYENLVKLYEYEKNKNIGN